MSVRVFAPAKINLTLKVGRPRADGLHPLQSVAMFANVGDVVEAAPAEHLSLRVHGRFALGLAGDETNLVLRAARALAAAAGIQAPGAALSLRKHLPIASGIGGGSADAAATLQALNTLWRLNLSTARLAEIARELGADVPVCVAGRTAYMTGAGESFAALDAPTLDAVLVNPLRPLATADVYRRFDAMALGGDFVERAAPVWRDRAALRSGVAALGNDLEAPARVLMPEIGEAAAVLSADARVLHAGLSGSGATLFALVEAMDAAASVAESVQRERPDWWVQPTQLGAA